MAGFSGGPRVRAWAAAAVLLLVGSSCSGCSGWVDDGAGSLQRPGADEPAEVGPDEITADDFAAVRAVLDRRARALRRGDRPAFVATLDRGNARLRRSQLAFFDNVQALPVSRLYYGSTSTGLPGAKVRGDDPTLRPVIFEHLLLDGVNALPIANEVSLTFVRRDGRWLLGAEALDEEFPPQVRPWYGGRIEVARDGELLVATDDGADVGAEALLDSTREALQQVGDVLDEPDDPALFVDATSNGLTTSVAMGSDEEAGAVAFSAVATNPRGDRVRGTAGSVVQANPEVVEQLVSDERTLRHEMAHVLLDGYGTTNPHWVTEGIAEYAGYYPSLLERTYLTEERAAQRLARDLRRRPVELTPIYAWGDQPQLDYLLAHASAEFLIQGYGMARYREMMDLFKQRSQARGRPYGDGLVGPVLREVYGLPADDVARAAADLIEGLTD